jgi:predicted naringenin-chalcone synthase
MTVAHVNAIGCAHPPHDFHAEYLRFAQDMLADPKSRSAFTRMSERAGIAHRHTCLPVGTPAPGKLDHAGFYERGKFPGTAARMAMYQPHALSLASAAVAALGEHGQAAELARISHLIVASCTGLRAPGLEVTLMQQLGLSQGIERSVISFMGCAAAVPALRAAQHIVRADPQARVLVVNVELCSLHLQETVDLGELLAQMLFADGVTAALVSADPVGMVLQDFRSLVLPDSADCITWDIGDHGFRMHLSGQVPARIAHALARELNSGDNAGLLHGWHPRDYALWAVHAGGRSILDAVEASLQLSPVHLAHSRAVLNDYGNMSSATLMFTLARIMRDRDRHGSGMALAFGPGIAVESFRFRKSV